MTISFALSMTRRKLFGITIFVWILATEIYAYFYVTSILAQPISGGYETEWQFQLLMFLIFRLPWLFVGLVVIIAIEKNFKCHSVECDIDSTKRDKVD
ncbi:MAG TPA: hypothetical protein VIF86_04915 [Methylobacter sp.]|jgi:hypothetical protein